MIITFFKKQFNFFGDQFELFWNLHNLPPKVRIWIQIGFRHSKYSLTLVGGGWTCDSKNVILCRYLFWHRSCEIIWTFARNYMKTSLSTSAGRKAKLTSRNSQVSRPRTLHFQTPPTVPFVLRDPKYRFGGTVSDLRCHIHRSCNFEIHVVRTMNDGWKSLILEIVPINILFWFIAPNLRCRIRRACSHIILLKFLFFVLRPLHFLNLSFLSLIFNLPSCGLAQFYFTFLWFNSCT